MTVTLPYRFRSPQYWSNGSAVARSDGHVDVTQTKPNGLSSHWMAWQGEGKAATGDVDYDLLFGPTSDLGQTTIKLPNRAGITSDNPLAFLRVVVSPSFQFWPLTAFQLATLDPLPSGWFEVFYYGSYSFGPGKLPIMSFTARPTSLARLDMRVSLDGGTP